jgi:long-chain fatty acid transport protein
MLNLRSLALVAAIAALLPSPALAGGFTIPLVGARMSGQSIFVGYPDDTSAIYHNPAGLTLLKGYRVDISALGIYSGTDYRRYEGSYSPTMSGNSVISTTAPKNPTLADSVKPDPPFGVLPNAGFSGDFGLEKWRFGLAIYSPHNATGNFPADGPQRYQVIKGTIFTLYTMPTVAFKPLPWLSVAAQVGPAFARISYERSENLLVQDGHVKVEASAWSVAWGLGVLIQPFEQLSIGVSYSSNVNMDFQGEVSLSNLPKGALADPNATSIAGAGGASFDFPRMLRVGAMWHFSKALMVGAEFQWQNYAVYDALRISLDDPLEFKILGSDQEIKDLTETKDSSDAFTAAVGGRYTLFEDLDLRAGAMFDKSPYPDKTYTILNPDHDKAGFSLGASYRFGFGLELTVAYVHLFYFDRTITETSVCQRRTLVKGGREACAADTEAGGEVHGKMVLLFGGQASYIF